MQFPDQERTPGSIASVSGQLPTLFGPDDSFGDRTRETAGMVRLPHDHHTTVAGSVWDLQQEL